MKAVRLFILFLWPLYSFSQQSDTLKSTKMLMTLSDPALPYNKYGRFSFEKTIEVDSLLTSEEIHGILKKFILNNSRTFAREYVKGKNYSSVPKHENEHPLKHEDFKNKKLINRVVSKYIGPTTGCVKLLYLEYDLLLQSKDGRFVYEVTNFSYTHYNTEPLQQMQINGSWDAGYCKSKGSVEDLQHCPNCKQTMYDVIEYLMKEVNTIISEIMTYFQQQEPDSKK